MASNTLEFLRERKDPQVLLDGRHIELPEGAHSLSAIRSHLETLTLQRQRVLCSFCVDGVSVHFQLDTWQPSTFSRIEAETFDLDQMPVRLLRMATEQARHARMRLETAISLVLVSEGQLAREFWWNLARDLKQPLLTIALLPDSLSGYNYGGASVSQLRKWQLEQLGIILGEVDQACWAKDPGFLAAALETRVVPWLANLQSNLDLLLETALGQPSGFTQTRR